MKNKSAFSFKVLLLLSILTNSVCYSQNEILYSQMLVGKEFFNPAYGSFKDYPSINMVRHEQWKNGVDGAPRFLAVNINSPLVKAGLNFTFNVMSETIGLRENLMVSGLLSHRVRISEKTYLALGYGLGIVKETYNLDKVINPSPDINLNTLYLNETIPSLSLGTFLSSPHMYVGLSMNTLVSTIKNGRKLLPGFDFSMGGYYFIRKKIRMNPDLTIKYYKLREKISSTTAEFVSGSASSVDVSLNFLFNDRIGIGTAHRFNYAQSFSFDLVIHQKLKIGYTYELGIGRGINKQDSQGFRLSWTFINKKKAKRNLEVNPYEAISSTTAFHSKYLTKQQ